MNGCVNPKAVNYNPSADVDDHSCLYLMKHGGNCHLFTDFIPDTTHDKSFTLSYSLLNNSWVFFHDYLPDYYIHTRDSLYALSSGQVYKFHEGQPGIYLGNTQPKPFFIDVIFKGDGDMILETINWTCEFISSSTEFDLGTLTHISIWNNNQHTGRIVLNELFQDLQYRQMRRTKGEWSFNDFRDIIATEGEPFLLDIFNDYALDTSKTNLNMGWYDQKVLQDKWFCVRFEFDNSSQGKFTLHDTNIQALKTDR